VTLYQRTLELNPDYARAHLGLGWAHEQTGDLDAAIAAFQTGSRLSGSNPSYTAALGHAHAIAGQRDKALEQLRLLTEMSARVPVSPSYFASVHAGLDDHDATFEWLEQARQQRSGALAYLHVDPQYARLRSDHRFVRLVETIGIAPEA
jgi:tetratricopeptide (TPR) repeat protein